MGQLSGETIQKLLPILGPLMRDKGERQACLQQVLGVGSPLFNRLEWDGSTDIFIPKMIDKLVSFGEISPGKPVICALLEVVRDKVGLDKQQEIDSLLEIIREKIQQPTGALVKRPKIFQAPPLPEYYVDRPEVSRDLKHRLLTDNKTLVVSAIHGLGSVGKSTLAVALAHDPDIQNYFSDGVLWATLGQEPDVLSLLSSWVQSLGDYNYRATAVDATSNHLRSLLIDKAVLLVVDDAWIDKNNAWKHVEAFKVGGSRCCMLVTTRDASIGTALNANTCSLDVMSETQALELLRNIIQTQVKQLEESEIESAKVLAKAVGYLPLALELIALKFSHL